jgi:hypothetical protein
VDSSCSESGPVAGCCECGDEPSGSGATEFVRGWLWKISRDKPSLIRRHRGFVCDVFKMFPWLSLVCPIGLGSLSKVLCVYVCCLHRFNALQTFYTPAVFSHIHLPAETCIYNVLSAIIDS